MSAVDGASFAIAPAGQGAYWLLAAITLLACAAPLLVIRRDGLAVSLKNIGLAAILVLPFTAALGYAVRDNSLRVEDGKILLRAARFYQHDRPLTDFDLARARVGSYDTIEEARLGLRRNGIGLPGYAAGRFSGPGKSTIFALLTDRGRVVFLPAKQGPSLLISVTEPEAFLAALGAGRQPGISQVPAEPLQP